MGADQLRDRAHEHDAGDPLASYRGRFLVAADDDVVAYLDGNSLGRPLRDAQTRLAEFVGGPWAGRLIRGWTDEWLQWPTVLGDQLGRVALGASPGQVVVADSTSVLLYKLARAAVDARPDRREVVLASGDFPTDRYVLEGVAAERGLTVRWVVSDRDGGIEPGQLADVVGADTALVVLSHVAYWSGHCADAAALTRVAHDAGALILWDLSHSVGVVPLELDAWDVDLTVGCGYKYLNGGPGAPAFAYVSHRHQDVLRQPIWGWLGRRDPFAMASGYEPAAGIASMISGTPPILAMVPLRASLDLLEEVGIAAVRAKSTALTGWALQLVDAWLVPLGAEVGSPRDPARLGGHVTLRHRTFRGLLEPLWARGVIPDFREPDGLRIGLAPLSTSFVEVHDGLLALRELMAQPGGTPSSHPS